MPDLGRILVADDDETFLYSTADLLRREGYQCDCALDGATAAEILRSHTHDLFIADVKMPGNSDLELVKEARDVAKGIPVILVTGHPSLDTAVEAIELPANSITMMMTAVTQCKRMEIQP